MDHLVNLVVVIVGISIAFGLNRYSENKKEEKLEQEYLKSFSEDLKDDVAQLQHIMDTSSYWMNNNQRLTEVVIQNDFEHDSLFFFVISLYQLVEFTPSNNTFQTLMSSGNFYLIDDFELRKKITSLYNSQYEDISYLDKLHRDLQMNKLSPYLNENVKYSGRPVIQNKEFLKDNYFINLAFNNLNLHRTKFASYKETLDNMNELNELLEKYLNR